MGTIVENSWMPGTAEAVTISWVEANGLTFEVAETGAGDHLALCLHGFPELHYSGDTKYRCSQKWVIVSGHPINEDTGSTKPAGIESYTVDKIVADAAGLFDTSGTSRLTILGHDWGNRLAFRDQ